MMDRAKCGRADQIRPIPPMRPSDILTNSIQPDRLEPDQLKTESP
jgi:hypothetical protein